MLPGASALGLGMPILHDRMKMEEERLRIVREEEREREREIQREKEREREREREQREKEQREREQREREQREKEQREKEQRERELREKEREVRDRERLLSASHHYSNQMYGGLPRNLLGQLLPPVLQSSMGLGLRPPQSPLHSLQSIPPYHTSSQRQSPHSSMGLNLGLGLPPVPTSLTLPPNVHSSSSLNLSHHTGLSHSSVSTSLALGHPVTSLSQTSLGLSHSGTSLGMVPVSSNLSMTHHAPPGLNLSHGGSMNLTHTSNLMSHHPSTTGSLNLTPYSSALTTTSSNYPTPHQSLNLSISQHPVSSSNLHSNSASISSLVSNSNIPSNMQPYYTSSSSQQHIPIGGNGNNDKTSIGSLSGVSQNQNALSSSSSNIGIRHSTNSNQVPNAHPSPTSISSNSIINLNVPKSPLKPQQHSLPTTPIPPPSVNQSSQPQSTQTVQLNGSSNNNNNSLNIDKNSIDLTISSERKDTISNHLITSSSTTQQNPATSTIEVNGVSSSSDEMSKDGISGNDCSSTSALKLSSTTAEELSHPTNNNLSPDDGAKVASLTPTSTTITSTPPIKDSSNNVDNKPIEDNKSNDVSGNSSPTITASKQQGKDQNLLNSDYNNDGSNNESNDQLNNINNNSSTIDSKTLITTCAEPSNSNDTNCNTTNTIVTTINSPLNSLTSPVTSNTTKSNKIE